MPLEDDGRKLSVKTFNAVSLVTFRSLDDIVFVLFIPSSSSQGVEDDVVKVDVIDDLVVGDVAVVDWVGVVDVVGEVIVVDSVGVEAVVGVVIVIAVVFVDVDDIDGIVDGSSSKHVSTIRSLIRAQVISTSMKFKDNRLTS